ncbi:hypothetical protein PSE10A_57800 [Pseudomonas amygdali pv. eriobotryae]|uniref:Tip attachment protein J central straight fiber domain-containing protein n=2 Tax=Pseudomonas syringae group genomosp. 2 TaxID=251698 RepID=A0A9P3AJR4_PSEA0|nr:hypothetical protein PSE10A_57800 [Pseudomonas amygdali pv. eriobotryae]
MTMRTIKLYGVLRKHFGREYRIDVHSVRDAVNALCAMKPGFEKFLRTGEERGLVFSVFCGKRNAGEAEFDMQGSDTSDIRIVPLIQGSKQAGLFQVVLGVALVVAGAFTGGLSSGVGMALLAGGAAVGLGGVVQMLSPTTTASVGSNNDDGNNPSYGFGGAVMYTVKLQVNANGQYVMAAIAAGIENVGGVLQSQILMSADRFALVNTLAGGAVSTPFVAQNGQLFLGQTFIQDGTITNAKIGSYISSTNYIAGQSGWILNKDGTFEINSPLAGGGKQVINGQGGKVYDERGQLRYQWGNLAA